MKEINLKNILEKCMQKAGEQYISSGRLVAYEHIILQAMKEACNQTVNLCTENTKTFLEDARKGKLTAGIYSTVDAITQTKNQIR